MYAHYKIVWIATIILGRDISLSIAAFYYRYASLPPPKIFTRYFDFSLPSAEVHPTDVSKFNTFLQILLIGATTALPVVPHVIAGLDIPAAVQTLGWVVASTTVWSGMSYVWRKDVVVILGNDEALKKKQGFRGRMIIGTSFAGFLILAAALAKWEEWKKDELIDKQ
jgi:cardiolipin synthase